MHILSNKLLGVTITVYKISWNISQYMIIIILFQNFDHDYVYIQTFGEMLKVFSSSNQVYTCIPRAMKDYTSDSVHV